MEQTKLEQCRERRIALRKALIELMAEETALNDEIRQWEGFVSSAATNDPTSGLKSLEECRERRIALRKVRIEMMAEETALNAEETQCLSNS